MKAIQCFKPQKSSTTRIGKNSFVLAVISILAIAATLSAQTPPPAPTGLSVQNINESSATLSWGAVTGASNYRIQFRIVSFEFGTSLSSTTSKTLTGLRPSTEYEFQVQARFSTGTSTDYSEIARFTTAPLQVPTGLSAQNITPISATLSWGSITGATLYKVEYRVLSGVFTQVSVSTTSHAITGLIPATEYEFKVTALAGGNVTSSTSSLTRFTTAPPAAPTGLSATNITSTGATLTWAAVPGARSYKAEYHSNSNGFSGVFTTVLSSTTSKAITGLNQNLTYEFRVQAIYDPGPDSPYSDFVSFRTPGPPPPSAPTGLSASNITSTSVTLSWGAVDGASKYFVSFLLPNGGARVAITTATSQTITDLTPATEYNFKVSAAVGVTSTDFSSPVKITTLPTIPTGLSVQNISATGATLTWGAVAGATSYAVQYRVLSGAFSGLTATTNSQVITGLRSSSDYEFKVKAVAGTSSSSFSSLQNFRTSPPCTAPGGLNAILTPTSVTLSWRSGSAASSYVIQFGPKGSSVSSTTTSTTNSKILPLSGIHGRTTIEWKVKSVCSTRDESAFSASSFFTTP